MTGSEVTGCALGETLTQNPEPELACTPDAEVEENVLTAPAPAATPRTLPFTGRETGTVTAWALGLLAFGTLLIHGSRRRATA